MVRSWSDLGRPCPRRRCRTACSYRSRRLRSYGLHSIRTLILRAGTIHLFPYRSLGVGHKRNDTNCVYLRRRSYVVVPLTQIPADWTLDIQAPALPPDTRPATELHPCPVLLARIAAQPTGVPVAPAARTHSQLARLAEAVFGWAAPYSQPAPTSIPVDLTFERLYLGVIPATALRMLPTMLAVLVGPIVLLACGRRL